MNSEQNTELILFRRQSENDEWEEAPFECQFNRQESEWMYKYFLIEKKQNEH